MRIVLLSHTDRSGPFRVGSHHLAREFAALGHQVAHISNPISLARVVVAHDHEAWRRLRMAVPLRLHQIDGAAFAVPWSVFPLTPDPLHHCLPLGSTRILRRKLASIGLLDVDLMLVDQPLLGYLIDPIGARSVVLRPTDINRDPDTQAAERRLLSRVAGVIATSQTVADGLLRHGEPASPPMTVVENGVDLSHFRLSPVPWAQRAGAVYVGALDHRLDWATLIAMGTANPRERIDVFGPLPKQHPELPGNVTLRGPAAYDALPAILAGYRVGLLPLNDDPTNAGRSPMKLYEYLATGMLVVARGTRSIVAGGLRDVRAYSDPPEAAATLTAALAAEPAGDGVAAAQAMGWPARARLVLDAAAAFEESSPPGSG